MSDDSITNFLQSQPAPNSSVQVDDAQNKDSQGADFKQIFSYEEKRLFNDSSEVKAGGRQERASPSVIGVVAEKGAEAIRGQNKDQVADEVGSQLPSLSLHNGALAVGRVIYTSKDIAVTTESLSKFMARQGLVNDSLKRSGTPSTEVNLEQEVTKNSGNLASAQIKNDQGLELTRLGFNDSFRMGGDKESLERNVQNQVSKEKPNPRTDVVKPNVVTPNKGIAIGETERLLTENVRLDASEKSFGKQSSQVFVNKVGNDQDLRQLENLAGQFDRASLGRGELGDSPKRGSEAGVPYFADKDEVAKLADVKPELSRESLKSEVIFKNKEYSQENLSKNQNVSAQGEHLSEIKKEQVHQQLHLQRVLGEIKETISVARESDNSKPMSPLDFSEPGLKGRREAGQYASQETVIADLSQTRVEFKGALKEVQRLVSTNVYNNLTDSYESWNSRFGEVLANRIAGHISRENWNVQFKMNPASLGEISLEIDFSEKGLEGRLGANEESTRQLLQDSLPKLRLALREILDANHGLKLDVGDFGNSNHQGGSDKQALPNVVEEINFESEILVGNTLDPELGAVVGLNILV